MLAACADSMVAAVIAIPHAADFKAWPSRSLKRLLVLEGLQDPGNLVSIRGSVMLRKLVLPAACRHDTACLQSLAWSPGQLAQA